MFTAEFKCPFSIVSQQNLNCETSSKHFQQRDVGTFSGHCEILRNSDDSSIAQPAEQQDINSGECNGGFNWCHDHPPPTTSFYLQTFVVGLFLFSPSQNGSDKHNDIRKITRQLVPEYLGWYVSCHLFSILQLCFDQEECISEWMSRLSSLDETILLFDVLFGKYKSKQILQIFTFQILNISLNLSRFLIFETKYLQCVQEGLQIAVSFHVVKYVKPCTSGLEAPLRREDKQSWKSFIIYNLNYVMYFPAKTGLDSPNDVKMCHRIQIWILKLIQIDNNKTRQLMLSEEEMTQCGTRG